MLYQTGNSLVLLGGETDAVRLFILQGLQIAGFVFYFNDLSIASHYTEQKNSHIWITFRLAKARA